MPNTSWQRVKTKIAIELTRHWPSNAALSQAKSPIVSFSFDDFPHSAASEGAAILERFSLKATYFVSGARLGRKFEGIEQFSESDLEDLARHGHEIGCHTFSHIRVSRTSRYDIESDIARNREFITRFSGGAAPTSFAYPYGDIDFRTKKLMSSKFPVCRGIDQGINRFVIDFGQLKSVSLTPSLTRSRLARILDMARSSSGWLIFFTHDISDTPSRHGCTRAQLTDLVQDVLDRGLKVLPLKSAAEEILDSPSSALASPDQRRITAPTLTPPKPVPLDHPVSGLKSPASR